jgi:hypothetical protein
MTTKLTVVVVATAARAMAEAVETDGGLKQRFNANSA